MVTTVGRVRYQERDILPPDNGCEYAPKCLECPLLKCAEELSPRALRAELERLKGDNHHHGDGV